MTRGTVLVLVVWGGGRFSPPPPISARSSSVRFLARAAESGTARAPYLASARGAWEIG